MGGRRLPHSVIVIAAMALLAACGGAEQVATPTATVAPAPSPTAEPAAAEPTSDATPSPEAEPAVEGDAELPAELDIASLQESVSAFDAVFGAAVRRLAEAGGPDEGAQELLRSIYGDRALGLWNGLLENPSPELLAELADPPGDPSTQVTALLLAEPGCVAIAVDRDFSAMFVPGSIETFGHPEWHMVLAPAPEGRDPAGQNPTPWYLVYDGFELEGGPPQENPC